MGELGKTMQELRIHRKQMQGGGYGYVESQPVTCPFAQLLRRDNATSRTRNISSTSHRRRTRRAG